MNAKLLKDAQEFLPRCRRLADAELALGVVHDPEQPPADRDWVTVAQAWGLFDGWHGRPRSFHGLPGYAASTYKQAYHHGSRLGAEALLPTGKKKEA